MNRMPDNKDVGKERFKRKAPQCYKFSTNKIIKLFPTENIMKGTEYPQPRSGHRIIFKDGDIYAFGGYNVIAEKNGLKHLLFDELWKFNYATKRWKLLKTTGKMPNTLASHCATLANNQMLVFGGTSFPFGATLSDATYICDLDTLEWTKLETTGTPPQPQYGQAMAFHDDKVYIVGGTDGFDYCMDVHCLDLNTKVWEELRVIPRLFFIPWVPAPRYRHEIAIHNNQIFVFGGGSAGESFDVEEIPIFDLETRSWRSHHVSGDHPKKRRCHGCVQFGSDVYVCGGLNGVINPLEDWMENVEAPTIHSDIWKFSLESLKWEKIECSLPSPVYFHSTAISKTGQLFIFGGVNSINNTRTNELITLWAKVPPLADMAWDAILKYAPHLPAACSRQKMYELGIPLKYIEEIDFENSAGVAVSECCRRVSS